MNIIILLFLLFQLSVFNSLQMNRSTFGNSNPHIYSLNNVTQYNMKDGCPKPEHPMNGYVAYLKTHINSEAKYYCYKGYHLSKHGTLRCTSSGKWNTTEPKCLLTKNHCGKLPELKNGFIKIDGYSLGNSAIFKCDYGYQINLSNNYVICHMNGQWSEHEIPQCKKIKNYCPNIKDFNNGKVQIVSREINGLAEFYCDVGYELTQKDLKANCSHERKWIPYIPSCQPINNFCPQITPPDNGFINNNSTRIHSKIIVTCLNGYELSNSIPLKCLPNKKWSHQVPKCQLIFKFCPLPDPPINGRILSENIVLIGKSIEFACNSGYNISSDIPAVCQINGKLSENVPTCELNRYFCDEPKSPKNGNVFFHNLTIHSIAKYNCTIGYKLLGEETNICTKNGEWKKEIPKCLKNEVHTKNSSPLWLYIGIFCVIFVPLFIIPCITWLSRVITKSYKYLCTSLKKEDEQINEGKNVHPDSNIV